MRSDFPYPNVKKSTMKILAIDIGTGTQDILLLDTDDAIENAIQMVMPAPTIIASKRVKSATQKSQNIKLTGKNMGGGPVTSAIKDHISSGFKVYATPEAATTFDDDLDMVEQMGVLILSDDEMKKITGTNIILGDLDIDMLTSALMNFDVEANWDIMAAAVFDHGNAPPGYSDRKFRFDHLLRQINSNKTGFGSFVYLENEIPDYLTRMKAVSETYSSKTRLLLMDTAEAAVLGSLEDHIVRSQNCKIVTNIGNEHTLAFHLHDQEILGIFEHHTHMLSKEKLETHLENLVIGNIDGEMVWKEQGHGAIVISGDENMGFLSVIGPMRNLLADSKLNPYFATPHGSMMLAGPFGLVRACAEKFPEYTDQISDALSGQHHGFTNSH